MDQVFLQAARDYGRALAAPMSGQEMRELFRRTSIPYRLASADPLAPEYRREVLDLFKELAGQRYDTGLEMTSTRMSEKDFELGYPWWSHDLAVATFEMAKVVQALRALRSHVGLQRVVEFGSGWGNLAVPLAKLGLAVTAVDIDGGFLARLRRMAEREMTTIETVHGEFLASCDHLRPDNNAVIFQASFHHCIAFVDLLDRIRDGVLAPDGTIFFFCEPIMKNYAFPWGLRFDGEALWAIMCNQWLELGFDQDFFISMLGRSGFLMSSIAGVADLVGPGWKATRADRGIGFADLILPESHDRGFFPVSPGEGWGRYCRAKASLPGAVGTGRRTCALAAPEQCAARPFVHG